MNGAQRRQAFEAEDHLRCSGLAEAVSFSQRRLEGFLLELRNSTAGLSTPLRSAQDDSLCFSVGVKVPTLLRIGWSGCDRLGVSLYFRVTSIEI